MMPMHMIPVMGFGSEDPIGHWDDIEELFVPLRPDSLFEEIEAHWEAWPRLPLVINVAIKMVDGVHYTYRSIGEPTLRSIVIWE